MIENFADKRTERLFEGSLKKGFPQDLMNRAITKLDQLDAADKLTDLELPPSNHLEPLKGTRKGFHSIRINDQWRVCFKFKAGNAYEVQIEDYH